MGFAIYLLSSWGWMFAGALGAFALGVAYERRRVTKAGEPDA